MYNRYNYIYDVGKVLNRHKYFTEVDDIATQFDLFNLVSDAIREVSLSANDAQCI